MEQDLLAGLSFYNWIGVLVYAVIGAVIAAYDYPDRTLQLWLGRGMGRPRLWSAQLVAMMFFGLLAACFTVASLLALGVLSRFVIFGTVESSSLDLSALLPVTLRAFWSGLPYLALALLLAVVSRSPLVAAAGTFVYGCVFERLALQAGGRFPAFVRYLPASLSQVLLASNAVRDRVALPTALQATQVTPLQAFLWIGALSGAAQYYSSHHLPPPGPRRLGQRKHHEGYCSGNKRSQQTFWRP